MLSLSWSNNNLIFSYLQELSRDLEDEDLNDVDVAMPSFSTGQMHENITRKENILKSNTYRNSSARDTLCESKQRAKVN